MRTGRFKIPAAMLYVAVVVFMLSTVSCDRASFLRYSMDMENQFFSMELQNEKAMPLRFVSNEKEGSICYQTKKGFFYLKGEPAIINSNSNSFEAEWKNEERSVRIRIVKTEYGYDFSFSAMPDNDILSWSINLGAEEDEYFTGIFERTVDGHQSKSFAEGLETALNLHGEAVEMLVQPTLGLNAPFYISSNGYGAFIKGTWPGNFDFCKSDPGLVRIEFEGPSMEGTFYCSSSPMEIVKQHSIDAGTSILPPKWAFEPVRWRDDHSNNEFYYDGTPANKTFNSMLVEDVLMMEAYDIPCGAYWIDRPWAKGKLGYDDFEWDETRFPNAEQMLEWLNSKNLKPLLWIAPWVSGEMAETAREKNYAIPFEHIGQGGHQKFGYDNELALIDFSNEEAVKWWQEEGLEKILKQGVKGFKMDRSEELVPYDGDYMYANGKTAREMRNAYPLYYAKAANEIAKKIHGDDFIIFPRAGYTGSAKYAIFWGGDIGSQPEGLRTAIIAIQRASVMGYPIWGSDIGGYWHARMDSEVTKRWLAFGCFNPFMEFGPTENRGPWDTRYEPSYDTTLIATWRLYAKIHEKLVDYSYEQAIGANKNGTPIVRPLFLDYPDQEEAWEDWQTFTYGPDILVSAIWKKGIRKQKVYLPAGERWLDAWDTDKIYEGGHTLEIEVPLHKLPIFIKEGSPVELGDLNAIYAESLELAKVKPDLSKLSKSIDK